MSKFDELRPNQRKAVEKLAAGYSTKIAASAADVTSRTVQLWMKEDAFKSALSEANEEIFGHAVVRLKATADDAVKVLRKVMNDVDSTPSQKIRAADVLLTHLFNYRKLHEFEQRLEALEREITRE